jgi:hypothetical protein
MPRIAAYRFPHIVGGFPWQLGPNASTTAHVNGTSLCPSRSIIIRGERPFAKSRLTRLWRELWKRRRGKPSQFNSPSKRRLISRGSIGFPKEGDREGPDSRISRRSPFGPRPVGSLTLRRPRVKTDKDVQPEPYPGRITAHDLICPGRRSAIWEGPAVGVRVD